MTEELIFVLQELALRNVLYVSLYCPSLRDNIFELAVHQMLAIDVSDPYFLFYL